MLCSCLVRNATPRLELQTSQALQDLNFTELKYKNELKTYNCLIQAYKYSTGIQMEFWAMYASNQNLLCILET